MAIMIPDEIPETSPESEKIIFNNLKHAAQARDWVVFYSKYVENPRHSTRPREIDFIILIPEYCSVICLEVKGGHYEIRQGKWYKKSTNESLRSPLDQSSDAMYALKEQFKDSHFRPESLLSVDCAVAFTDGRIPSDANSPRRDANSPRHLALMIGSSKARNSDRLVDTLNNRADQMRPGKIKKALDNSLQSKLAQIDWHKLKTDLEANMEIGPEDPKTIFRSELETRRPQLLRLTADQVDSLDIAEENPRCTINGAAGTGKTVLAMELAKRRCEDGETVALLCSNPNLSHRFEQWAKELSDEYNGEIVAGTPATLPSWAFRNDSNSFARHQERLKNSPELEESLKFGYLHSKWSSFIRDTIDDLRQGGIFDYLVVDEAQNLCPVVDNPDQIFLKLMDAMLKGGLAGGRFTMFGDFAYQDIVFHQRNNALEGFKDGRDALQHFIGSRDLPRRSLRNNCRNTHEIADTVAKLTNIPSFPLSGVRGPDVQIEYFKTKKELQNQLNNLVCGLKKRKFRSSQIILLSSNADGFAPAAAYGGWELFNIDIRDSEEATLTGEEDVVNPQDTTSSDILRYSDVYDFQGLESEVAILVIPVTDDQIPIGGGVILPREDHLRKMLYTGMSRAKAMLIIVADESYRITVKRRLDIVRPPAHR